MTETLGRVHPGQNLTLLEAEEIERFCVEHSRDPDLSITRRNLVTRGVRQTELVNAEFAIGNVRLRGIELCESCVLLGNILSSKSLSPAAVIKHWVHRGGLLADVPSNGEIARGDCIETALTPPSRGRRPASRPSPLMSNVSRETRPLVPTAPAHSAPARGHTRQS